MIWVALWLYIAGGGHAFGIYIISLRLRETGWGGPSNMQIFWCVVWAIFWPVATPMSILADAIVSGGKE